MSVPSSTHDSSESATPVDLNIIHRTPQRLPTAYLYCATLLTNTIIIFLLVNVLLATVFYVRDLQYSHPDQPVKSVVRKDTPLFNEDGSPVDNGRRSFDQLRTFDFNSYENIGPDYAAEVLDGFWELTKLGFAYEPWMGFAEPPFASKLVNVDTDAHGFPIRRTVNHKGAQGRRTVFIFVMGGSHTFGYSVSDEHTWGSQLSRILNEKAEGDRLGINVEVVNYGKAYYYPSQETALLVDLLRSGQRPSLVVFMDGVNTGYSEDVPYFTNQLAREMMDMQFPSPLTDKLSWIPIVRLADALRVRIFHASTEGDQGPKEPATSQRIDQVVNQFNRNMEMSTAVATLYGAKTLFLLQPNIAYHYSTQLLRKPIPASFKQEQELAEKYYGKLRLEPGRIDLSELFEKWGTGRKAISDDSHYSPGFNEFLARNVANHIDLRSLESRGKLLDESSAGGEPRRSYFLKTR